MNFTKEYMALVRHQVNKIGTIPLNSEFGLNLKAVRLLNQCDTAGALEHVKKCYFINPANLFYVKMISKIYLLMGKLKNCQEYINIGLKINKEDKELLFVQADCLTRQDNTTKALQVYNQILAKWPSPRAFIKYFQFCQVAGLPILHQKLIEARQAYPQDLRIGFYLVQKLIQTSLIKKAINQLNSLSKQNPLNFQLTQRLAYCHHLQKNTDDALSKYKQALYIKNDSPQILNNFGKAVLINDKIVAASQCLKKALFQRPDDWRIHFSLGQCYFKGKLFSSAYIQFNAACLLAGTQPLPYSYLALTLLVLQDSKAALIFIQRAIKLIQQNENQAQVSAAVLIHAIRLFQFLQHKQRAEQLLKQLNRLDLPENGLQQKQRQALNRQI